MIYLPHVINLTFARFFISRKYNRIELKGYYRLIHELVHLALVYPVKKFNFKHEIVSGSYEI